jgi:hypothetical protein
MDDTAFAYATWSADEIVVYRRLGTHFAEERLFHRTPVSLRYFVRLFRRSDSLLLRTAVDSATVFHRASRAGTFSPISEWPGQLASLPIYRVTPLRDGGFVGLPEAENVVILWWSGQSPEARALPTGFHARAVDQDEQGRLYVAGSIKSIRLRSVDRRHAFAVSADLGRTWDVDEAGHGGLANAWYSLLSGAELEYHGVTVAGQYIVLHAGAGEIGEESTLVYIRDPRGHWTSDLMRNDLLRAAVTGKRGEVQAFSYWGKAIVAERNGHRHRVNLVPRLRRSLSQSGINIPNGARFQILTVDSSETDFVMLVSIQAASAAGTARFGESIFTGGIDVAHMAHLQRKPNPEIVTMCVMPGS